MRTQKQICDCEIIHKKIVDKVSNNILDDCTLSRMSDFYKAFSDKTRIKIINALDCHEMCVCDIAVLLNMTKSAVSHQLKYLKNKKIATCIKKGKIVFYKLADKHVKQLFEICHQHIMEEIYE